jgi:mannose-6-phosphate isomerase-like protein (cupin superfamily)
VSKIDRVDIGKNVLDIHRDLSIAPRAKKWGPPERIDGMTVGIDMITADPPHGGEVHPDGDEILYVISGRFRVVGDSAPDAPLELLPGDACIVRKGEWHLVNMLEPGQLLHITPGPRGDHRPPRA